MLSLKYIYQALGIQRTDKGRESQRLTFSLNLEAWVGVSQTDKRPLWAKAWNSKGYFLVGKGGCIWCGMKVARNSRTPESSVERALNIRLWALNLISEAMGAFGGLETGQMVRAVFDTDPLVAAWIPHERRAERSSLLKSRRQ